MIVRTIFIAAMMWLLPVMGVSQTMQEKLYYTCKVWGFVKYYHSEVSVCNVNWDSVLIDVLPDVRAASNSTEFNDALMRMLNAAGPMAVATTPLPDTLPVELKRNRDWTFISTPILRTDVQAKLNVIKNNFVPHYNCWMTTLWPTATGALDIPHDAMMLDVNTMTSYPDIDHRLLMFFKWWNLVRYFNPYNYVLDVSWETTLYNYVVPISNVNSSESLWLLVLKISKALDDAHVYGNTRSYWLTPPGYFMPKILLKYASGEYVVMRSLETGIERGDILVSIDGKPIIYWEDSLRQYYSAGNESVFRNIVSDMLLRRQNTSIPLTIVTKDDAGNLETNTVLTVTPNLSHPFFSTPYYPLDTLNTVSWTTLPCEIGYVNMGVLTKPQIAAMYCDLRYKEAIIFDLRRYPNSTAKDIADKMYPTNLLFEKAMLPNITYPGTYYWSTNSAGVFGNPNAYAGKVIVIIDAGTQSQGEYSCMIFERMPDVIKIGSQTAGADGDVTKWNLTQEMTTGMSSVGIFYPNGDSTQRIGILPDSVVMPTAAGIRQNRDEVLERALGIAGCDLFLKTSKIVNQQEPVISIYPNPANEAVTVRVENVESEITLSVIDIYGRVLMQEHLVGCHDAVSSNLNIEHLVAGMYFLKVESNSGQLTTLKFVKE